MAGVSVHLESPGERETEVPEVVEVHILVAALETLHLAHELSLEDVGHDAVVEAQVVVFPLV